MSTHCLAIIHLRLPESKLFIAHKSNQPRCGAAGCQTAPSSRWLSVRLVPAIRSYLPQRLRLSVPGGGLVGFVCLSKEGSEQEGDNKVLPRRRTNSPFPHLVSLQKVGRAAGVRGG